MKKIIAFSTLVFILSGSALAFDNPVNPKHPGRGIFVGGDLGYGYYDAPTNNLVSSSDLNALAWYINIGFQFNPYVALEGGYLQFNGAQVAANNYAINAKVHGDSLLLKLIYPFKNKYSVFGKLGFMEMYAQTTGAGGVSSNLQGNNRATPELGVGGGYNLSQHVIAQAQELVTFSVGSLPATYSTLVGVRYLFNM